MNSLDLTAMPVDPISLFLLSSYVIVGCRVDISCKCFDMPLWFYHICVSRNILQQGSYFLVERLGPCNFLFSVRIIF